MLGQRVNFLGILLGTYLNQFSAPVVGEKETFTAGNELPIGVSFVVPASSVIKVLDSEPAQKRRDMEIQVGTRR
jgi:hypothetical protein